MARGLDMDRLDPEVDRDAVAQAFGVAKALVCEIMFENDEGTVDDWKFIDVEICGPVRPYYPDWNGHTKSVNVPNEHAGEQRWRAMRAWAVANLKPAPSHQAGAGGPIGAAPVAE